MSHGREKYVICERTGKSEELVHTEPHCTVDNHNICAATGDVAANLEVRAQLHVLQSLESTNEFALNDSSDSCL